MIYKRIILAFFVLGLFGLTGLARENIGYTGKSKKLVPKSGDCTAPQAYVELNVNNIRAGLMTGGDMWWDLNNAQYEVPKVDPESGLPSRHSIFAGSLWIGGIDELGQLKMAAQTYRQSGSDFYPGYLDDAGAVCQDICSDFDQFFEVSGADINAFLAEWEAAQQTGGTLNENQIPESLLAWPGRNNPFFSQYKDFDLPLDKNLAPFWDADGNREYDPTQGDYPVVNSQVEGVFADQMIWWMINDKGNVHTETGGEALGLEIGSLAFAFATNDEVNNMTFYRYDVLYKGTVNIDSVYFGQWVDPDLGTFDDDFVGCDTLNSLGIVYNGDAQDEGDGYQDEIPMLGVDFFQGPKKRIGTDSISGNPIFEELGMSSFLYYDNNFTVNGNPETVIHYYGYLAGAWKDGTPFTFGGNGYQTGDPFPYMFPSAPNITGSEDEGIWSECSAGNPPDDRRFLQSSGPFVLEPGARNNVIVGVVWVPDLQYPCPSFDVIIQADQKAQALFDSDFKLKDGPDAPNLTIREMDQELIISLSNAPSSNNFNEEYSETDAVLSGQGFRDSTYIFQGYRIFQLSKPSVSVADYNNVDLAREIFTVDIEGDEITTLINYTADPNVGSIVPSLEVEGSDNGIRHTFRITEDQFALGDKRLINHKRYYFSALAYGYNGHEVYDPEAPSAIAQREPYLAGRKNIRIYTAIPHSNAIENGGTVISTSYGTGPEISSISGQGNGGLELELTPESIQQILSNGRVDEPTYLAGAGPVDIKIYDPLTIPDDRYRLEIINNYFVKIEGSAAENVSINGDGTLTYTSDSDDEAGFESFNYTVANELGTIELGSVLLRIGDTSNSRALAADDSEVIITEIDVNGIDIDVLANDQFPSTAGLIVDSVLNIVSGNPVTIKANGKIGYRSNNDFRGLDSFDYIASNDAGDLARATVYVNVLNKASTSNNVVSAQHNELVEFNARDDVFDVEIGESTILNVLNNDAYFLAGSNQLAPYSSWVLREAGSNDIIETSERPIVKVNEQGIGGFEKDINSNDQPLGFTVSVKQVPSPDKTNGLISGDIDFADNQNQWFFPYPDFDGTFLNWITPSNISNPALDYDPAAYYSGIIEGTAGIAPYCLVRNDNLDDVNNGVTAVTNIISPGCRDCHGKVPVNTLQDINSVDIVFTSDKSLWSKCVVLEMGKVPGNNLGGVEKNSMRSSPSKDKDGNEISGEVGRSWFPGYAIDVQNGVRLNVMFGENTFLAAENGADMLWNPSNRFTSDFFSGPSTQRMGGEHYIYVVNTQYDEGNEIHSLLSSGSLADKEKVFDDTHWVVAGQTTIGFDLLSLEEGLIPTETTIKARVNKSYTADEGNDRVIYEFGFDGQAIQTNVAEVAKNALDNIRVVPNPYYAFSAYENSQFDNTIKITNLPDRANIKIFTLKGTLVRALSIDSTTSSGGTSVSDRTGTIENALQWDLKNFKGVPIASGMYLFHVEAPDLGVETTLKWFGLIRPIDLDTF